MISRSTAGPKRRRHYAFDENVNEPASQIEAEPTDIQGDNPIDDNEPIEQAPPETDKLPPAFIE